MFQNQVHVHWKADTVSNLMVSQAATIKTCPGWKIISLKYYKISFTTHYDINELVFILIDVKL